MENEKLMEIVLDAYQYHANVWYERQSKKYKQKVKKETNEKLRRFHWEKMKEYDNLLDELKKSEV